MLPSSLIAAKATSAVVSSVARRSRSAAMAGSLGSGARNLSTERTGKDRKKIDPDSPPNPNRPPNAQDFVKVRIEPGSEREWDRERTDTTYRPPWRKNRARILSAEDFANRPRAGFHQEFASPHDAMVTLTWLTQEQREGIYRLYLDMMTTMAASDRGVTSHEYVMRVIAQKYGISATRAAAIVQLEHDEDRIRRDHPEQKIYYDAQEYVDAKIREHIRNVYEAYNEKPPDGFVETPTGVTGMGDPDRMVHANRKAEDLYDVDALTKKALIRKKEEARLAIDGHVYIEDVDDREREVKLDGTAKRFLKAAKGETESPSDGDGEAPAAKPGRPEDQTPLPENGRGIGGIWADKVDQKQPSHRPRWKYAAKIIDTTKDAKKIKRNRKLKKTIDKGVENTLIEHDGHVRPATVEEAANTAWKPTRNFKEFTFKGVKRAWLDRTLKGEMDGWGRVERDLEKEREMEEKAAAAGKADEEESAMEADGEGNGSEKTEEEGLVSKRNKE